MQRTNVASCRATNPRRGGMPPLAGRSAEMVMATATNEEEKVQPDWGVIARGAM